ncbi:hypothetical protein BDZ94DRAFT_1260192 [Collybia nuda]|uniref:J domain-containing protein n=1 Tax=Collybia nuda TaxID=64659 RepID=A0A9P5Y656_9AGAR|nr:hypothetical protein BDZ94DRAFT_1260192 [Collybia nuda]
MATNLYEVLELHKDASPEQIRKAYKRKALKTHPDRLPPGATPEDKTKSEEEFRLVNNAYEVLNDSQKRRVYDLHGVWPPPELEVPPLPRRSTPSHHRSHSQQRYHNSRDYHFQESLFGDHYDQFVFTDPFALFDSIFGDLDNHHPSSFHHHHRSSTTRHDDFERGPHHMPSGFASPFGHPLFSGLGHGFHSLPSMAVNFPSANSSRFLDGNRGRWTGESYMTTTVNGVTQSVRKRRDWDGNEHVTRTFPDGREVRTINGVEQPARSYISSRPARDGHHLPSPAAVSQPHIASPRGSVSSSSTYLPPPPYPGQPGNYTPPSSREPDYRHHNRRFSETRPMNPDSFAPGPDIDHRRKDGPRKRWWR